MARSRFLAVARRGHDEGGAAAVEFAFIFPLLLVLAIGSYEVTIAVALYNKLNTVSNAVADIISRERHTTPEELISIGRVARQFVEPYRRDDLKVVMSGVTLDPDGEGTVVWSEANGTQKRLKGERVQLNSTDDEEDSRFVVLAELTYTYVPVVDYGIRDVYEMSSVAFRFPRVGGKVDCHAC